jgi:hypothetical protein
MFWHRVVFKYGNTASSAQPQSIGKLKELVHDFCSQLTNVWRSICVSVYELTCFRPIGYLFVSTCLEMWTLIYLNLESLIHDSAIKLTDTLESKIHNTAPGMDHDADSDTLIHIRCPSGVYKRNS